MADQVPNESLVNVRDPDTMEIGSLPASQLQEAMAQGYTPATPEEAKAFVNQKKYGSAGQQAITGLEGAGVGSTFGLSTGVEEALGVNPEDIRGRREVNPGVHGVGEAAGLAGSAFIPGVGEAGLLEKAGLGAGKLVGLGAEEAGATAMKTALEEGLSKEAAQKAKEAVLSGYSIPARIGSAAVKHAVDTGFFQTTDEVSKMLSGDPNQTVETAAVNVGLAGLLGGSGGAAIGAVSPLWKATMGGKVGQVLKAVADRANGIDGVVPDAMNEAIQTSGLNIPPEVKTALSDNPQFQQMFKTLEQSDTTKSGLELQETYNQFRKGIGDTLVQSLGKSPEDLKSLGEFSKNEAGKSIGESLANEFQEQTGPLADKFEKLKLKYSDVELPKGEVVPEKRNVYGQVEAPSSKLPGFMDQMADRIANLAEQEGWTTSPSGEIMKKVGGVLKDLPQLKKLSDLTKFITQVGNETYDFTNPSLTRAGSLIKSILKDGESELVVQKLGQEGPELVAEHQMAREAWKAASDLKESLDSRLHVGGGDSIGSFIKNLKSMSVENAEKIFQRLSGKNDAQILSVLSEKFPKTAELLKQYHVDDLLRAAAEKAGPNETISSSKLLSSLQKMSPELRQFAVSPEASRQIEAIGSIIDQLDKVPHNFSNTARTLDKLSQYIPGSAVAIAAMVTGHNPALGLVMAPLVKYLGKDMPDAIRLGLLKFLGSNQPIEAEGFKHMVDFIQHTIRGENLLSKASKAVLRSGMDVLPQSMMPNEKSREKLDQKLQEIQKDPKTMLDIGGKTAHYLPDHGGALAQTSMNAVNLLNSMRPSLDKKSPLDTERVPSKMEKAQYAQALDIAQQPLIVLKQMKDGTLTSKDVQVMKSLYPALYSRTSLKLYDQISNSVQKGENIPYRTRMSMSLFLQEPLDSTLTPSSILAAQPQPAPAPMPQPKTKHSMTALNKMPGMDQTPSQSREQHRIQK